MVPIHRCIGGLLDRLCSDLSNIVVIVSYSVRCRFMYSMRAFSSSSLILRADPVLLTTNFIQSCQVCLSILIEVLALTLARLNNVSSPIRVIKVGGNYHKLHILIIFMVMWYNGNTSNGLQEQHRL